VLTSRGARPRPSDHQHWESRAGRMPDVLHEGQGGITYLFGQSHEKAAVFARPGLLLWGCFGSFSKSPICRFPKFSSSPTPHVPPPVKHRLVSASGPEKKNFKKKFWIGLCGPSRDHDFLSMEVDDSARPGDDAQAVPLVGLWRDRVFLSPLASQSLGHKNARRSSRPLRRALFDLVSRLQLALYRRLTAAVDAAVYLPLLVELNSSSARSPGRTQG